MKTRPVINENVRNVKEIIIPLEKREDVLNELRHVFLNRTL